MKQIKLNFKGKLAISFFVFTAVLSYLHIEHTLAQETKITNENSIEIAKKKLNPWASRLGYNLDQMGIKVSKHFIPTNPYLPTEEDVKRELEESNKYLEKLNNELKKITEENLIKEKKAAIKGGEDYRNDWENIRNVLEELKDKIYWSVHFFTIPTKPNVKVLDGSFTVFVDTSTGKILFTGAP